MPEVTDDLAESTTVVFGDTFLLVGGSASEEDGFSTDAIWQYDQANSAWILLPQRLQIARHEHTAYFVPDDFVSC